eukprot:3401005-Prymnesium_polylepis.1
MCAAAGGGHVAQADGVQDAHARRDHRAAASRAGPARAYAPPGSRHASCARAQGACAARLPTAGSAHATAVLGRGVASMQAA